MRKERVWMVQTEQQYICIHQVSITVTSVQHFWYNSDDLLKLTHSLLQCLLAVLEGKEQDQRHLDQLHDNEAFEDDEGIAESGM